MRVDQVFLVLSDAQIKTKRVVIIGSNFVSQLCALCSHHQLVHICVEVSTVFAQTKFAYAISAFLSRRIERNLCAFYRIT